MQPIGSGSNNKQNRQHNTNYASISQNYNQRAQHQRQHFSAQQVAAAQLLAQQQPLENQQSQSNMAHSQQLNYLEQIQRLQIAQANQADQAAQSNHESHQQQAASVLRSHSAFQQNTHSLTPTHINSGSLHAQHPSTSAHRPTSNVLQSRNMNEAAVSSVAQPTSLLHDPNILAIITEISAGGEDTIESLTERIAASLKPFEVSPELANEKKTLSDFLEVIEKDRKHSDVQIDTLVRKMDRLKEAKDEDNETDEDQNENAIDSEPLWMKISNANNLTASDSNERNHLSVDKEEEPLYNEPRDAPGMNQLMETHKIFRPALIKYLMLRKNEEDRLNSEAYSRQLRSWKDKVKKWEDNSKKRLRDEKHRAIFENTFPDLKKAREDKERTGRGERTTRLTGSEFLSVGQKDGDEKKMRNAVAVPPVILKQGVFRKEGYFDNTHMEVKDAASDNQEMIEKFQSTWSPAEESMFSSRYREAGKNFSYISEFLPDKRVSECVLFYYLAKTRCNFKAMYRKKRKGGKVYRPMPMPTKEEVEMYRLSRPLAHNDQGVRTTQELRCCKCQQILDSNQIHGRSARDVSDMYGVYSNKTHDPAICHKCREAVHKDVYSSRCLIKTCSSKKGTKASKYMPPSFTTLGEAQRAYLHDKMGIPHELFKLCGPCLKELNRHIETVIKGECEDQITEFGYRSGVGWSTDESTRLAAHYSQFGPDFEKIASRMRNRTAEECKLHLKTMEESGELTNLIVLDDDDEDTQMAEAAESLLSLEDANDDIPMDNSVDTIEDISDTPPSENMGSVGRITPPSLDANLATQLAPVSAVVETSVPSMTQPSTSYVAPPSRESFGSASDYALRLSGGGGSITAGTPIRPPSISVLEHLSSTNKSVSSVPQQFLASNSRSASNRGTPQPPTIATPQLQQAQQLQQQQLQTYQMLAGNKDLHQIYLQALMTNSVTPELAQISAQWNDSITKQLASIDDAGLKQFLDNAADDGTRLLVRIVLEQRRKDREAAAVLLQQQQEQLKQQEQQQREAAAMAQLRQQQQMIQQDAQKQQWHQQQQQLLLLQHSLTAPSTQANSLAAVAARSGLDINTVLSLIQSPAIQNAAAKEHDQQQMERDMLTTLRRYDANLSQAASGHLQNIKQTMAVWQMEHTETTKEINKIDAALADCDAKFRKNEDKEKQLNVRRQMVEQEFGHTYSTNNRDHEPRLSIEINHIQNELHICNTFRQTFRKNMEDNLKKRQQLVARRDQLANNLGSFNNTGHSSGLPTPSGSFSLGSNQSANQLNSAALLQQQLANALGGSKVQSSSPLMSSMSGMNDRTELSSAQNQAAISRANWIKNSTMERGMNDEINSQQSPSQQQSAPHTQKDVLKRKSGLEAEIRHSVQPSRRQTLTVPHMRRAPSPEANLQQQMGSNMNHSLTVNTSIDSSNLNAHLKSPRISSSFMPNGPNRPSNVSSMAHQPIHSQLLSRVATTSTDPLHLFLQQNSHQTQQQHLQKQQKLREDQVRQQREKEIAQQREREERERELRKEQEEKLRRATEEKRKQEEHDRAVLERQRQEEYQRMQAYEYCRQMYSPSTAQLGSVPNSIGIRLPSGQSHPANTVISSALSNPTPQMLPQNVMSQMQPTSTDQSNYVMATQAVMPSTSSAKTVPSIITLDDLSDISDDETPPGHSASSTTFPVSNNVFSLPAPKTENPDQLFTLLDFATDDSGGGIPAAPAVVPRMPVSLPPADPNAISVNPFDTFECVSDDEA